MGYLNLTLCSWPCLSSSFFFLPFHFFTWNLWSVCACISGPILATWRGYCLGLPTRFSLSTYTQIFMLFSNYFSNSPTSPSGTSPPQQTPIVFHNLISSTNSITFFLPNWKMMSTMASHSMLASNYNVWSFCILFSPYLYISVFCLL